ncbi:hypothetical protein NPIL_629681 [Nephila pilipes]|uniref:Uncharacterized protein n=1 Tax=Nephila pilipes TaxID=299642 RepID=A0A8X6QDM7_NEPPI|nr:hypothetical protein NPIL_629681 [Nephila pilipes]
MLIIMRVVLSIPGRCNNRNWFNQFLRRHMNFSGDHGGDDVHGGGHDRDDDHDDGDDRGDDHDDDRGDGRGGDHGDDHDHDGGDVRDGDHAHGDDDEPLLQVLDLPRHL